MTMSASSQRTPGALNEVAVTSDDLINDCLSDEEKKTCLCVQNVSSERREESSSEPGFFLALSRLTYLHRGVSQGHMTLPPHRMNCVHIRVLKYLSSVNGRQSVSK